MITKLLPQVYTNVVTLTQKRYLYIFFSFTLFVGSVSWLIAPFLNHFLVRGPNLISEYEAMGMPHSILFRLSDLAAALTLISVVYLRQKTIKTHYGISTVRVLYAIGLLEILDTLVPLNCVVSHRICTPVHGLSLDIHGAESYLTAILVFVLAVYIAVRYRKILWIPVGLAACSIAGYFSRGHINGLLLPLQVCYLLLSTYLLWFLSIGTVFDRKIVGRHKKKITSILSIVVASNAVLTISYSILHLSRRLPANGLLFTADTAWLSQHTFLVSLTMLYLARAIRQGSVNAWRIIVCISFFEIINYAAIAPDYEPMIVFLLLFVTLLMCRKAFDKHNSSVRLVSRLKQSVSIVLITALSVVFFSALFHWYYTGQWTRSSFTPSTILVRTLLLDVHTNTHDPLRVQIFGQVLTAAGILLYSRLFLGLFLPNLLPDGGESHDEDYEETRDLLKEYGTSSEDSLKLWPRDKRYWVRDDRQSAVAYKQSGLYAFALAEPICAPNKLSITLKSFQTYCKAHGMNACWLMVTDKTRSRYEAAGMRTLSIGASALVDIEQFTSVTVRNKWWRWARNKSIKLGYVYETLQPPHSQAVLDCTKQISDEWLQQNKHQERTFALGYYDTGYINSCVLHVLKDEQGTILAFANQLPQVSPAKQATIDLMRYCADTEGVMAFLLSEIIISLAQSPKYTTFDLGFVPLALIGKQASSKALFKLGKKALKPVFSAQGLEQFKNKFDPNWQQNYIAWDGSVLDLALITTALQRALSLDKKV